MGSRFRAARYVSKLSVRDLGEKAGVSIHSVQNWERGSVPRDPGLRALVCEVLGVEEEVLWAEYFAKAEEAKALLAS